MARQSLQETVNRLWLLIRAGYPVIYIVSHEESRVLNYLVKIFRVLRTPESPRKSFLRWQEGIGQTQLNRPAASQSKEDLIKSTIEVLREVTQEVALAAANQSAKREPVARAGLADSLAEVAQLASDLKNDLSGCESLLSAQRLIPSLKKLLSYEGAITADLRKVAKALLARLKALLARLEDLQSEQRIKSAIEVLREVTQEVALAAANQSAKREPVERAGLADSLAVLAELASDVKNDFSGRESLRYLLSARRSIPYLKKLLSNRDAITADSRKAAEAVLATLEDVDWLRAPGMEANPSWTPPDAHDAYDTMYSVRTAGVVTTNETLSDCIIVFSDVHRRLEDRAQNSLVRPVRNAASDFRQYYNRQRDVHYGDGAVGHVEGSRHAYKTIIIVAPSAVSLSSELERDLLVVDFPLPEKEELLLEVNHVINSGILKLATKELVTEEAEKETKALDIVPEEDVNALFDQDRTNVTVKEYRQRLCDLIAGAGRGLTLDDFQFGLNQMAIEGHALSPKQIDHMLDLKAKTIKSQAIQYTPNVKVNLGGLDEVKRWIDIRRGAAVSDKVRRDYRLPAPKGVLLCGPAGGGKSKLAQMIASRCNLALLRLDVGALFGSYVGESEQRTRDALKLAEVLAPVVLWLDEIDKAFTGIGSGDGGVSARVFGHFLTWLAEKEDSVFVAATANDFNKLLVPFPEFGRKGRFDETFWVGLPNEDARKEIFEIYLQPLRRDGYLQTPSAEQVEMLTVNAELATGNIPKGDPFEQFCWLLSRGRLSEALTGAEIEYAISEATYHAYDRDQRSDNPQRNKLVPELIIEMVEGAKQHALYKSGSDERKKLDELKRVAAVKHWIGAR